MFMMVITMDRDITRLDVRLLLAFEVLSAERNVTRAAERTGTTQQGMSGQLARQRTIGLMVPGFSVVGPLLEQTDMIAVLPERLIGMIRNDLQTFETPVSLKGFRLRMHRRGGLQVPGIADRDRTRPADPRAWPQAPPEENHPRLF